jgi:hypothetical protein
MTVDTSLRTLTLQNAAVSAAIGTRYHIDRLPDNVTYPCVRAQTIADPSTRSHGGTFGGRALVQLDIYDDDPATRDTAATAIIGWLDNYRGALGSYNVTIQVRNRLPSWEPEARLFRALLEIEILYFTQV